MPMPSSMKAMNIVFSRPIWSETQPKNGRVRINGRKQFRGLRMAKREADLLRRHGSVPVRQAAGGQQIPLAAHRGRCRAAVGGAVGGTHINCLAQMDPTGADRGSPAASFLRLHLRPVNVLHTTMYQMIHSASAETTTAVQYQPRSESSLIGSSLLVDVAIKTCCVSRISHTAGRNLAIGSPYHRQRLCPGVGGWLLAADSLN